MKIQPFRQSDCEPLYRLYREQTIGLPFHHNVRRDQFAKSLCVTRYIRNPADHHEQAELALVAKKRGQPVAYVAGGLVTKGDEVVESGTGYIQAIIAESSAKSVVKEMVLQVVSHLRRYRPNKIVAHDGCMCPAFFADSAGCLPSQWAWIGWSSMPSTDISVGAIS